MLLRALLATAAAGLTLGAAPALAAPPPNDAFAAAAPVTGLPAELRGTVDDATRETGEPSVVGRARTATVWYRFDAPRTGSYVVDTCESAFDTVLGVFTGTELRGLTRVAENDDACSRGSRVIVRATAGTTYWLTVARLGDTASGDDGTFTLAVTEAVAPPNDAFADATRLARPGIVSGSTLLATTELGEPEHPGDDGVSVWYRYRPSRTTRLDVRTLNSGFDPALGVFVGDLGSLRRIAQNDDSDGQEAGVRFTAVARRTYFIAVSSLAAGSSGAFELALSDGGARGVGLSVEPDEDQTLPGVLSRGLRATLGCRVRCQVALEVRVSRTTQRRLRLRSPVLARGGGRLRAGRDTPAVLRLARAAAPALRRAGTVTVRLRATLAGTTAADRVVEEVIRLGEE